PMLLRSRGLRAPTDHGLQLQRVRRGVARLIVVEVNKHALRSFVDPVITEFEPAPELRFSVPPSVLVFRRSVQSQVPESSRERMRRLFPCHVIAAESCIVTGKGRVHIGMEPRRIAKFK